MTCTDAVKLLWDVKKFSGEENEDAEEFLKTLDEIVLEGRMADVEILSAVSTVLKGEGWHWWRTSRNVIETWGEFKVH